MPNGPRIRANNVYGVISDNPLTPAGSTFNSASLPLLPIVSSAHAIVVFDPKRVYGDPEIVVVTAHTVASTVASILRGQYGTSPREHPQGTAWAHVPVDEDWTEIVVGGATPSDPYRGQEIFDYTQNRYYGRSTADVWQQMGYFFDPPHVELWHSASQNHATSGTWQAIIFTTEEAKTIASMHDNVINPSRIVVPVAGIYQFAGGIEFAGNATGRRGIGLRLNSTGTNGPNKGFTVEQTDNLTTSGITQQIARSVKLAANDYVELVAFQSGASPLAMNSNTAERNPYFTATYIGRGNS